jgi:Entner-Doudoroff aldolase
MHDVDRRTRTLRQILEERVSAILRVADADLAREAMRAAVDGGFRVIEFTLTTPSACELITEFAREAELVVGAGTVLTVEEVEQVEAAGASFVVSPICDPEVIRAARDRGLVTIPGTVTPTEMMTAWRAGADLVKLFPAPPNVQEWVASILRPLPELRIFPTSGITLQNFLGVLGAGAAGVGFVGPLFRPDDLAVGDHPAIRDRARSIFESLRKAGLRPG